MNINIALVMKITIKLCNHQPCTHLPKKYIDPRKIQNGVDCAQIEPRMSINRNYLILCQYTSKTNKIYPVALVWIIIFR